MSQNSQKFTWHYISNKYFYQILVFLLLMPLLTLPYSINITYGLHKIINLLFFVIPSILFFRIIIEFYDDIKIFMINSAIMIAFASIILILIISPFSYEATAYGIMQWSHIAFGRISLILLFILLALGRSDNSYRKVLAVFGIVAVLILAYSTGSRLTIIFTVVLLLFYLIKYIIDHNAQMLIILLLSTVFSIMLISVFNESFQSTDRYEYSIGKITNPIDDYSFGPRVALVDVSLRIIQKEFLFGLGFGGFNSDYINEFATEQKYPHNIILESFTEMGLLGLFWILILIYIILKNTKNISTELFLFFLIMTISALFSKNIASQPFLWVGLAFVKYQPKTPLPYTSKQNANPSEDLRQPRKNPSSRTSE
ncbi:MAG: O-antigen ligase family protein [Melioribacteraceae bacterium]|nr:O-antigen ligase family protein [Melioribacteraceae bacterium]MCF8264839.1 O-antigen ligase family protein [Melioribacteraceae bacterium]MCF8431756.1 O-antigen ligase family protein [Melioribacteraceae bacterium]